MTDAENDREQNKNIADIRENMAIVATKVQDIKDDLLLNRQEHREIKDRIRAFKDIAITKEEARRLIQSGDGRISMLNADVKGLYAKTHELEIKQNITIVKLAAVIAGIVFAATFAINALWSYLSRKL